MIANLQKLAFTLIGLGFLTLIGYACYVFIRDVDIPLPIAAAVLAIIVGFLVLLAVVTRDAVKKRRTEHFEGIEDE